MNPELLAAHRSYQVLGANVLMVKLEHSAVRQLMADEVVQRCQHHRKGLGVQARRSLVDR